MFGYPFRAPYVIEQPSKIYKPMIIQHLKYEILTPLIRPYCLKHFG